MNDSRIRENISKNLAYYRKKCKLTQKELGDKMGGVAVSTISGYERGANSPDIETLFTICNILNVSLDEIYGNISFKNEPLQVSTEETQLLFLFNKLSRSGKDKLLERAEELVTLGFTSTSKGEAKGTA